MAKAAGIREVAEAAGVSIGTVSNVVNRPELVSAQMLARVQATMAQLGFVRNDLARQMKMGGGTTLGAIVLNIGNPFFADLAHALELAAEERGYISVLASSNQSPERENRYIDLFERAASVYSSVVSTSSRWATNMSASIVSAVFSAPQIVTSTLALAVNSPSVIV